jgi:hypothetical protein
LSAPSEFTIIRYNPELRKEWEELLIHSNNGTIFHSHQFFDYHPAEKFCHHHLMFKMRGKYRALFTAAEIESEKGWELRSHPGASYGGFVIRPEADFQDYFNMVGALVDYAQKSGFQAIRLTQTPLIYYRHPIQGIEYALYHHGFQTELCALTQSVNLQSLKDNIIDSLVDKTRNAFRQALKKGMVYSEGVALSAENLSDFHRILTENRRFLGVKPTHTLEELIRLAELIPDKLHLAFAEKDGVKVAGLLHFICNPQVVLLFYVCHLRDKQDLKSAPFLLANSLKWAKENGYQELDFGISTVEKGLPNPGLLKFKENFCTRPFLRNTYRIEWK